MRTITKGMILLMACCWGRAASAQVTGGLAAGVSYGSVRITNLDNTFSNAIDGKNIRGFEAGFFLKLKAGPVYLRPQALYNFRAGQVTYTTNNGEGSTTNSADFTLHKISVPVLLGFHILGPVFVEGGPVFNYIANVTETYGDHTVSLGNSGLGYRVGAGADFGRLMLHLSYQGAATYNQGSNKATFKEPYQLTLGLGLMLSE